MVSYTPPQYFGEEVARGLGYTGPFGSGAAQSWLNANPDKKAQWEQTVGDKAWTPAGEQAPGIRPLNVASQNQYQQEALYDMGQPQAPIDPRISQTFDRANDAIGRMTTPYDVNSYEQFMNPYLQDVVEATRGDIERSYDGSRTRAKEEIAAAGGFGSSALGQYLADIEEAQNRQIGSQLSGLRYQGFGDATGRSMDVWRNQNANNTAAASQFMNLSGGLQNFDQYGRGVTNMGQDRKLFAGDRIQGQQQNVLDSYFSEVDREMRYPYEQTNFLQGVLGSYPRTGGTSTTTEPGVGAVPGAIGGAMLGNQMGNYFGGGSGGGKQVYSNPIGPQQPVGQFGPQQPWMASNYLF